MTDIDIANMPKVEMHLHVEGAIREKTYIELRRKEEPDFEISEMPWHNPDYRFNSLDHFLTTASPCVTKRPEVYYRIAGELFEDLAEQNVVYTEMTIATTRMPVEEVAHAIQEAWLDSKKEAKIEYVILVGLFRSDPPEVAIDLVRQSIEARRYAVAGVDLLEHETSRNAAAFTGAYELAREAGLGLRAHAGEGSGSESVWDVIKQLNVSRIAHGTRSVEDQELVEYLSQNEIVLDMCPTSNYRLQVVDAIEAHPIRKLFDAGVPVTVSSDDPLFLHSDVTSELELLSDGFLFTSEELLQLQRNALVSAFISQDNKEHLMSRIDAAGLS